MIKNKLAVLAGLLALRRPASAVPFFIGLALLFMTAAFAANAQDPDGKKLAGPEISSAIFGNTMIGYSPAGATWKIHVDKQGNTNISLITRSAARIHDRGVYVIEGDLLCATWQKIRDGQKICVSVFRKDDTFRAYNPDGSLNGTYEVRPGQS